MGVSPDGKETSFKRISWDTYTCPSWGSGPWALMPGWPMVDIAVSGGLSAKSHPVDASCNMFASGAMLKSKIEQIGCSDAAYSHLTIAIAIASLTAHMM